MTVLPRAVEGAGLSLFCRDKNTFALIFLNKNKIIVVI